MLCQHSLEDQDQIIIYHSLLQLEAHEIQSQRFFNCIITEASLCKVSSQWSVWWKVAPYIFERLCQTPGAVCGLFSGGDGGLGEPRHGDQHWWTAHGWRHNPGLWHSIWSKWLSIFPFFFLLFFPPTTHKHSEYQQLFQLHDDSSCSLFTF